MKPMYTLHSDLLTTPLTFKEDDAIDMRDAVARLQEHAAYISVRMGKRLLYTYSSRYGSMGTLPLSANEQEEMATTERMMEKGLTVA